MVGSALSSAGDETAATSSTVSAEWISAGEVRLRLVKKEKALTLSRQRFRILRNFGQAEM
jgi:hypothetical protein